MEIAAIETLSREELIAAFTRLLNLHEQKDSKISYLKFQLAELTRALYGSKSERSQSIVISNQLLLELGLPVIPSEDMTVPEKEEITYTRNKPDGKKKPSRSPLPSHIPTVENIIPRPEGTENWKVIGLEITSRLDYQPASIFRHDDIREKLVNPENEDDGVKIAPLPSTIIPKGKLGAGLIAYIIVSKFVDHLPYYRLISMFARDGVTLNDSILNDSVREVYKAFLPLYKLLRKHLLTLGYLQCDETPIKVLEKMIEKQKKKEFPLKKTHKGYFWVYYSPETKLAFFDYQKGRGREGPAEFLKEYSGILQTDGYSVYEAFDKRENIQLLGCMTHARRKFEHAKSNDKKRSVNAMNEFRKLYHIEEIAREKSMNHDQRKTLRDEAGAAKILEDLKTWCIEEYKKVTPESAIGKAISYYIGRYKFLVRYLENGRTEIDNNLVENSIRPVAIGRKNYMFAGSHDGADWAALYYTFTASCKSLGINPFQYFRDVITRLPNTPEDQLNELLPHNWKQQVFDIPMSRFQYPEPELED